MWRKVCHGQLPVDFIQLFQISLQGVSPMQLRASYPAGRARCSLIRQHASYRKTASPRSVLGASRGRSSKFPRTNPSRDALPNPPCVAWFPARLVHWVDCPVECRYGYAYRGDRGRNNSLIPADQRQLRRRSPPPEQPARWTSATDLRRVEEDS